VEPLPAATEAVEVPWTHIFIIILGHTNKEKAQNILNIMFLVIAHVVVVVVVVVDSMEFHADNDETSKAALIFESFKADVPHDF